MVRISKQQERRSKSPRRPNLSSTKTGSLKDNLPLGYKAHANASSVEGPLAVFIPKIK
ncbi:MAG: hypothetical protein P4L16_07135 [Chlamydiales bacterium]|nr:hypothetical protein [Chlamydiales bacterium]